MTRREYERSEVRGDDEDDLADEEEGGLLPVVVFSFSKKKCEEIIDFFKGQDLLSSRAKNEVKKVMSKVREASCLCKTHLTYKLCIPLFVSFCHSDSRTRSDIIFDIHIGVESFESSGFASPSSDAYGGNVVARVWRSSWRPTASVEGSCGDFILQVCCESSLGH